MVDDIQLIRISDQEEEESDSQPSPARPKNSSLPSVGAREALLLLLITGVLILGIGLFGGLTGEKASLLWLFGSHRLFGGSPEAADSDDSESETRISLSEVDSPEGSDVRGNMTGESAAVTRDRPEMSIEETDGEREVDALVKTLMRDGEQEPLPDASGIVSPIRRPLAATLEGIPQELTVLRRDVGPVLVGITYNETTVDRLADTYDTMLVVAPHHKGSLDEVLKYLPALIQTNGISGLGSARTFTVPAPEPPGPESESQATLKDLRGHKGEPLHPLARTEPDFLTMSAPPEWTGPARSVLSDYAPVIDIIEWDAPTIHVAGFVFDSAIELPDHIIKHGDEDNEDVEGNDQSPHSGTGKGGNSKTQPETKGGRSDSSSAKGSNSSTSDPPNESHSASGSETASSNSSKAARNPDQDTTTGYGDENSGPSAGSQPPADVGRGDDEPNDAQIAPDNPTEGSSPQTGGEPSSDGAKPSDEPNERSSAGDDSSSSAPSPDTSSDEIPTDSNTGPDPDHPDDGSDSSNNDSSGPTVSPSGEEPRSEDGTGHVDPPTDEEDDSQGGDRGPAPNDAEHPSPEHPAPTDDASAQNPESESSTDSTNTLPPADSDIDFGSSFTPTDGIPENSGQVPADDEAPNGSNSSGPQSQVPEPQPDSDEGNGTSPSDQPTDPQPTSGQPTDQQPQPDTRGGDSSPASPARSTSPHSSSTTPNAAPSRSSPPTHPAPASDDGPGIVPFGEAPASRDPDVVDVTEHVLNELTFQATATPDREVYSTVYADEDGLIRHHHAIDHPDFLNSRRDSISFTPGFFDHLRLLANLRKDINHRLAGGAHSHPVSGHPEQSPADKQFAKKVWRNQRNTAFIIGVSEGSGPDEWTITEDGYEAVRQSNEYLIRIRAFSGKNDPKQIRLHQDMGQ